MLFSKLILKQLSLFICETNLNLHRNNHNKQFNIVRFIKFEKTKYLASYLGFFQVANSQILRYDIEC